MKLPTRTKRRLDELAMLRFCRGHLTLDERIELKRLVKQQRQCERRRERYASDPEYRRHVVSRVRMWDRAQAQARA